MGEPHDVPTAAELVEAVQAFLREEVMPVTEGRVQFLTRVSANVLGIVGRELELGPAQRAAHHEGLDELGYGDDLELAGAIRDSRAWPTAVDLAGNRRAEAWGAPSG